MKNQNAFIPSTEDRWVFCLNAINDLEHAIRVDNANDDLDELLHECKKQLLSHDGSLCIDLGDDQTRRAIKRLAELAEIHEKLNGDAFEDQSQAMHRIDRAKDNPLYSYNGFFPLL